MRMWRMFAPAMTVLVPAGWFRCKRPADLFWAVEILSCHPFAGMLTPKLPVLLEQGDLAGSHRIQLHLSFQPWLARYCGVAGRNAPARSQRDKNRRQRRV